MCDYENKKFKFKCKLCHRTFSTKQKLTQHMNNKKIDCRNIKYSRNLKCGHCKETFIDVYKFKKHLKEKHNDSIDLYKKLQCGFCMKMFSSNSSLKRHCKNSCKVIKKHKSNLEKHPIRDFLDFLPINKEKLVILMKDDTKNIVFDSIDLFLEDSKNHNVYMGNQCFIYSKNKWIKTNSNNVYKKILDDIYYSIEEFDNEFYNNLIEYYSTRGQDNAYTYLEDKLRNLTSEDKINIY
jgi:hypothetical protein